MNKISEHDNVCCLLILNIAFTALRNWISVYHIPSFMNNRRVTNDIHNANSASSCASNDQAVKPRQEGKKGTQRRLLQLGTAVGNQMQHRAGNQMQHMASNQTG